MIEFDQNLADALVGKYVLIGITYQDHNGKEIQLEQMHGLIESASPNGILISFRGNRSGTSWNMPPMLNAIRKAPPGSYKLNSTGETIENPNFLITWIHQSGDPSKKAIHNAASQPTISDYDTNEQISISNIKPRHIG